MTEANRKSPKSLRRIAHVVAPFMAAECYDYTPDGELKRIAAPEAVEALRKAFIRLVQGGGQPQVLKLTERAAKSFPRHDPTVVPEDATPWLAVGFDVEGRATYQIEWIRIDGTDPVTERRMVEGAILARLAPELARAGFPEEAA